MVCLFFYSNMENPILKSQQIDDKTFTYQKFEEGELDTFCKIMDVENKGSINIADLEHSAGNLGLEAHY